jgi:hypothetical protein
MQDFLQRVFDRFGEATAPSVVAEAEDRTECSILDSAIEHVVDEVYASLRAIPGYRQRLREPVSRSLAHIDRMVNSVPPAFVCGRGNFLADRRVNAFFVNPWHISEVFSGSEAVRQVFGDYPAVEHCWGLLCMRREERDRFGMALVGDVVVRDVSQRVVNFSDHQVVSPGANERDARRALKCCIFNSFLQHVRQSVQQGKVDALHQATAGWGLQGTHAQRNDPADLRLNLADLDHRAAGRSRPLASIEDHFERVQQVLSQPEGFLRISQQQLHLDRMGARQEGADALPVLELTEISIASQGTRVGALVGFPREELLPRRSLAQNADAFLGM